MISLFCTGLQKAAHTYEQPPPTGATRKEALEPYFSLDVSFHGSALEKEKTSVSTSLSWIGPRILKENRYSPALSYSRWQQWWPWVVPLHPGKLQAVKPGGRERHCPDNSPSHGSSSPAFRDPRPGCHCHHFQGTCHSAHMRQMIQSSPKLLLKDALTQQSGQINFWDLGSDEFGQWALNRLHRSQSLIEIWWWSRMKSSFSEELLIMWSIYKARATFSIVGTSEMRQRCLQISFKINTFM